MKKTLILLILILATGTAYGRYNFGFDRDKAYSGNSIIIDQQCNGCYGYCTEDKTIDSLSQIPSKIRFIVNSCIKQSMTDFAPNIKFIEGQVFDIESKMANDSLPQIECGGQIPKYLLRYELSDSILNIKSFCLEIELDQYGQIIDLGWPSYLYNTREDFVKPQAVLALALKYCKKKKYKTNERIDELVYDANQNSLYWNIHFVQNTYGNSTNGSKKFVTIIIDARELTILYEYKNELAWTSTN